MSIALTGITCGSFAWFVYDTHAPIQEFDGVTIGVGELDIGFRFETELSNAEQYGLHKDDSFTDQFIYWFEGEKIEPDTLNYVLSANGYATNALYPVTTKKYSGGENFNLFSAPRILSESEEHAQKECYLFLPLVFRYEDIVEEGTFIPNENIYLSQVKLNTINLNSHIHESVRIYANNRDGLSHLINPSSSNDGYTDVGGTLDLDGDGFYDSKLSNSGVYEYLYGQVKESNYKALPEIDDTVVYPEQRTTFNAGHKAGTYAFDSFVPEVAEYEGIYGFRNKRKPVTITNPLTDNLAFLDLSIFVEGWDTNVIDTEIGIPFSMDLKFEVVI